MTWLSFRGSEVQEYFLTHEVQDAIGMGPIDIDRLFEERLAKKQPLARGI